MSHPLSRKDEAREAVRTLQRERNRLRALNVAHGEALNPPRPCQCEECETNRKARERLLEAIVHLEEGYDLLAGEGVQ